MIRLLLILWGTVYYNPCLVFCRPPPRKGRQCFVEQRKSDVDKPEHNPIFGHFILSKEDEFVEPSLNHPIHPYLECIT